MAAPKYPPVVARDALDDADWAALRARSKTLGTLAAEGARWLPDFDAMLCDFYCAMVRLVVSVAAPDALPAAAHLRATIVGTVVASTAGSDAAEACRLRPKRAGVAALRLGRAVLKELRAGTLMLPRELSERWAAEHDANAAAEQAATQESAKALANAAMATKRPEIAEAARDRADTLKREQAEGAAERAEGDEALRRSGDEIPGDVVHRIANAVDGLGARLDQVEAAESGLSGEEANAPGGPDAGGDPDSDASPGAPSGSAGDAGQAIDALDATERLHDDKTMRALVRMIGALRADALSARRKNTPRAPAELHGVTRGRDLARALPSELMALKIPILKLELWSRIQDGRLLTHAMRGEDRKGRGPVVIALDQSGSMRGEKSIWAKAIAMVIADLARRDGRAVTVLAFADRVTPYSLCEARRGGRRRSLDRESLGVLARAQTGGGTNLLGVLKAGRALIEGARVWRRADLMVITDGEARLPPHEINDFNDFIARSELRAVGVLIDTAAHRASTLEAVCDPVLRVSELDGMGAKAIIRAFDRG